MGCATSLVKFILFLFNFIIVVGGVCLVAFGAMAYSGYHMYAEFVKSGPYLAPPIGMMIIGSIIVIIAFMGCCGVLRESKCMMMTYASVLTILLVLEVATAVYMFQNQDEFKDTFQKAMLTSIPEYERNEDIKNTWDSVQSKLKCCGVQNYKDWQSVGLTIPESCCKQPNKDCVPSNIFTTLELTAGISIYTEGCVNKAIDDLNTDLGMYGAIAVAGVELLGIIFGCCLGARFGRKRYSV